MYGLFLNTYYDHPGECNLIRVSRVKEKLINSVKDEAAPIIDASEQETAEKSSTEHFIICRVEEI